MGLGTIPDVFVGWIKLRPLLVIILLEHVTLSIWCFFKGATSWVEPQLSSSDLFTVGFILGFFTIVLVTTIFAVF